MLIMEYQQVLQSILDIPMFQNIGQVAYNPSLDNIIRLCEFLGNPQNSFKSIHVAGTNGKGSSSSLLCSILQEKGLKVGLYTSPHMVDYRERITINSNMIDKSLICEFMDICYSEIQEIKPSFFEFTTALAFWAFKKNNVDIAIIETGLGGLIDSTNIINPIISLITNIGIDHKMILGDNITDIAYQKAGIIKHKIPVVISEVLAETKAVFLKKAMQEQSEITFAQELFVMGCKEYKNNSLFVEVTDIQSQKQKQYELFMLGEYQSKNLLGVLAVIDVLNNTYGYNISDFMVKSGVKKCNIIGRWQTLSTNPYIVCDVGHNYDGISEVVKMITNSKFDNIYMIIGFMQDKDISKILTILPKTAKYIATQASNARSMKSDELLSLMTKKGLNTKITYSVEEAVSYAKAMTNKNDMIFIGGSTFIVADYLSTF